MDSRKKIKNIFFRINFSEKIGLGHLLRMLIIAKKIKAKKRIFFIVDKINSQISKNKLFKNIIFIELYKNDKYIDYKSDIQKILKIKKKSKIDVLICDDYRCNENWQKKLNNIQKSLLFLMIFFQRKRMQIYLLTLNILVKKRCTMNLKQITKIQNFY